MSASNYPSCLQFTLKYEGGNSDDLGDPGGRTRKGVTQNTYNAFRDKHGLARQDVYTMPDSEMQEIYRTEYWAVVNGDSLRAGEDLCVFDFAVNSGPSRAKSFWSIAGGSRSAVEDLIHKLCGSRMLFLKGLATWGRFGKGWSARVAACEETAHKMAEAAQLVQPAPPVHVPQVLAPQEPVPVHVPSAMPAGLPTILPTSAGRIASGTDTLTAMREARIAELISTDPEVAAYDAALAALWKLVGASSNSSAQAQLPTAKPAASTATPQRTGTMETQISAMIRNGLIFAGGVAVSKGYVDNTTMMQIVGGVMSLGGAAWSAWGHRANGVIAAAAALPTVQKVVTIPAIADSPKFAADPKVVAH